MLNHLGRRRDKRLATVVADRKTVRFDLDLNDVLQVDSCGSRLVGVSDRLAQEASTAG